MKFTQPVSMICTREQYETDLKEQLEKLGYESIGGLGWGCVYGSTIYTNAANVDYIYSSASGIECKEDYNRYYIDHYNPELFLAIATMNNNRYFIEGEIVVPNGKDHTRNNKHFPENTCFKNSIIKT